MTSLSAVSLPGVALEAALPLSWDPAWVCVNCRLPPLVPRGFAASAALCFIPRGCQFHLVLSWLTCSFLVIFLIFLIVLEMFLGSASKVAQKDKAVVSKSRPLKINVLSNILRDFFDFSVFLLGIYPIWGKSRKLMAS